MIREVDTDWKWGLLAAAALTLLALYPQIYLVVKEGRSWAGAYAYFDTDEVAYSSYLNALVQGRPRRSDPYSGKYDELANPLPESLFSVQFLPPYLLAIPARALGISASTIFIILMPLAAFLSALAVFWLIAATTGDSRVATAGAIAVLCLGTLISGQGQIGAWLGEKHGWSYLPFLRRYIPAVPFPFFILLFVLRWKSLYATGKTFWLQTGACAAIVVFLNFSYFYLWTSAIAWLACFSVVWLIARPQGWRRLVLSNSIIGLVVIMSAIPYFILLSNRSTSTDQIQALVYTRLPDLFRPSELLAIACLILIAILIVKRKLSPKENQVLFAVSFLLLPVVVFNQQVFTGRSLQPFHYEEFVTTYAVLIAVFILCGVLGRKEGRFAVLLSPRVLFWIGVISFAYGANGASGISRAALDDNILRDKSIAVAKQLEELDPSHKGIVMPLNLRQGEVLPTIGSHPVLWAVHMPVFPGNSEDELTERFFFYVYYCGVSPDALLKILNSGDSAVLSALFGPNRAAPHLAMNSTPVSQNEIETAVARYSKLSAHFEKQHAEKYLLAFLVVDKTMPFDSANIDKWYERDHGYEVGDFIIYGLKIR